MDNQNLTSAMESIRSHTHKLFQMVQSGPEDEVSTGFLLGVKELEMETWRIQLGRNAAKVATNGAPKATRVRRTREQIEADKKAAGVNNDKD